MGTVRLHPRSTGLRTTISSFAHDLDAQRYVCPEALERRVTQLLDPAGSRVVLALSGVAGIGKSAALRWAARRARESGYTVIEIDGRAADAVAAADGLVDLPGGPALVVIDEADQFGAGLHALGRAVAELPATTRVVLGVHRTSLRWLPEHLEPLATQLRLGGLTSREAEELLHRYGVDDPLARRDIAAWAAGLPLALVLGAGAWAGAGAVDASGMAGALHQPEDDLVDRLAGPALAHVGPDLLAVAALAGGVDARLLAAVMPDEDAQEGMARLGECTFVERSGPLLELHRRLAGALAERLRTGDRSRVENLTLRIAAHLRDRAIAGEPLALPWLAGLVQDPALRAGLSPPVSEEFYADRMRPGDGPQVRTAVERRWPRAWPLVEPWLHSDAMHVVRRRGGTPVAVIATLPLARAELLPLRQRAGLGPVLEHARALGLADRAVLTPFQLTLEEDADPDVVRIRNAVGLQRCGVANPRIDLVVEATGSEQERAVLAAYGYGEVPAVQVAQGAARLWVADVGPGGLAGLLYDAIAAEQGRPVLARADGGRDLLRALEAFHCEADLVRLPVASRDLPPAQAAERIRVWVRDSVDDLLAEEPGLHALVVRRYLQPGATHESVMREQFASRATYFRRLRRARDLLAEPRPPG